MFEKRVINGKRTGFTSPCFAMRKKANNIIMSEVVLIIASIFLFGVLISFVGKTASSQVFYEELYAKKIGLIIESSSSGEVHYIDVSKLLELSRKNNYADQWFKDNFLTLNKDEQNVLVKTSSQGGFKFNYFSKKDFTYQININGDSAVLSLVIK